MGAVAKSAHFRLGEWLIVPQECRLKSDGASHAIEPKLMDVLVYRVEHADAAAETVAAAIDIAYNSNLAVAVLLSQRLIGVKRWVK